MALVLGGGIYFLAHFHQPSDLERNEPGFRDEAEPFIWRMKVTRSHHR